ncbi:MAG: metallophosphoesterase [Verrucomicrobia bacterium]|nr:metallophosphoesterase [Verrucomicrobiota bacterium]
MNTHITRRLLFTTLALAIYSSVAATLLHAAPPEPIKGGFTLAVLPDTQFYALKYPEIYDAQTKWIAENVKRYGIPYVLHVGDITDKNTAAEWEVAAKAHARMAGVVPCALLPGNHDLAKGRVSGLSAAFPPASFKKLPTFGAFYDKEPDRSDNSYHLFEAGGRKWLVIAIEYGPRNDVLRWANDVAAKFPDRSAILITHAYLRPDNTRYDKRVKVVVKGKEGNKGLGKSVLADDPAGFNDGEDVWQKVISQHANFAFVISGHVCITGRRTDTGKHGNPVHQILVDYQNQPNGGNGYLRLLQFSADMKTVRVSDYSPTLDQVSDVKGASFELPVPPAPRVAE